MGLSVVSLGMLTIGLLLVYVLLFNYSPNGCV